LSWRSTLIRLPGGNHPAGVVVEIVDDTFPLDSGNSAGMDAGDDVETVSFVSESGNEVARLRVTDVILLWNEFGEFYAPQPGSLYVAIIVEVTSFGSRGSLILRADDFRLQDIDGFLYGRSWADADDEAELVPSEGEVGVSPCETEELVLVYEVLIGVELSKLFWQPDYERLLTIADLNNYIPDEE
jgi:hypothetical protein